VTWQWHWAQVIIVGLLQFVKDGDVAVGEWHGDGRSLVAGHWSLLLLGPCPVLVKVRGRGEWARALTWFTYRWSWSLVRAAVRQRWVCVVDGGGG